jgi:flavin reductase (DIM6/NTAB) family NADH-FMN oxidoreductase RutF
MRSLAGAVNIITSAHAGHRYGMTATAVCSASAEPPTVLVCINKLATTHGAVSKTGAFCVNVLRAEDWQLSTTFSGAQSGEARFKNGNWTKLATGSPALVDALVSFDCRVVKKMVHGSHTVFLGQVEQMLLGQKGKPLLYSEGQYAKLAALTIGEPLPEGLDYWGF